MTGSDDEHPPVDPVDPVDRAGRARDAAGLRVRGCADLVFAVNDDATAAEVSAAVREALAIWEPRIDVIDVVATPGAATAGPDAAEVLLVAIDYEVRATNSRFNLVYPFYLE